MWNSLQSKIATFSEKLQSALAELGIYDACSQLSIDHICVRLDSEDKVRQLRHELKQIGEIISSVQVNGREISITQLREPLLIGDWNVYAVELPNPKPKHSYADGWEHVEFVLTETENTMDGVRAAFFRQFPNLKQEILQNDYNYTEDVPHAKGDQLANPTIGLKVAGVGIKFHANSIQKVVGYENNKTA